MPDSTSSASAAQAKNGFGAFWTEALQALEEEPRKAAEVCIRAMDPQAMGTLGGLASLMQAHALWVNKRLAEADLRAQEIAIAASKKLPKEALDILGAVHTGKLSEQMERAVEDAAKATKQIFAFCNLVENELQDYKRRLDASLGEQGALWCWILFLGGLVLGMSPLWAKGMTEVIRHLWR